MRCHTFGRAAKSNYAVLPIQEITSLKLKSKCNWELYVLRNARFRPVAHARSAYGKDRERVPSLSLGPTLTDASAALRTFLRHRQWLRTTPAAPLQLVQVPLVTSVQRTLPQPDAAFPTNDSATSCVDSSCASGSLLGTGKGRIPDVLLHSSFNSVGSASPTEPDFVAPLYILRDDLMHPILGGNKVRKLDALVPELLSKGITDVVTCGGVQSAHLAAVAVVAAEAGLQSHLLVRGEPPKIPSGYHLVTRMYGTEVTYVSRAEYANRQAMLSSRMAAVREASPAAKVALVAEGGGDPPALLGLLRLVYWLAYDQTVETGCCQNLTNANALDPRAPGGEERPVRHGSLNRRIATVQSLPYPTTTPYKFVVDSGTGTTAIGLALGIALLGLPWTVNAVMLAGDLSYYKSQQEQLVRGFFEQYGEELFCNSKSASSHPPGRTAAGGGAIVGFAEAAAAAPVNKVTVAEAPTPMSPSVDCGWANEALLPLCWLPRPSPRRFGKVLPGEIAACKLVAQLYGIGLDPIYSLAAWEVASREAVADVVMAMASVSATLPVQAAVATSARDADRGALNIHGCEIGSNCSHVEGSPHVVMLHGGGALGLHGLAQLSPTDF
ncbi:hypothetical protein VaNZ11_014693 [Volvox africanus]|uniref:Tryptophan synthase beta chain-like PALP domain-containing protein n=1 Tax=Volvox africanus TaxID=51714 RepID=A0ABQ5SKP6_9CHLO|nr:hypothetical protein VaNZ11_014693 [Volvox africanus]